MDFNKVERAIKIFNSGYSCAQAVFSSYSEDFGLPFDVACKLSSALGGGIGRQAYTCGALSSAALIIGLKFGSSKPGDSKSKEKVYSLVRKLFERFKEIHGNTQCKELLNCDISTTEGLSRATNLLLFKTKCPDFVQTASIILEDILNSV
ncbi:MAG TPA: C-GCAxxG-C-C family protein [Verrucomicrobiota bacterium]|nr:C-GCAxxG-C-C family protein [Verrucomicrobiota bacterium]